MSMTPAITRRGLGKMAVGAAAASALCASPAIAQTKRLAVVVSAVYKRSFDRFVIPKMKELHNIEISSSALLSAETLARSIAQKASPQVNLVSLDQGPWLQGKELDLWTNLDPKIVPNLADIPAAYRDADGMGSAVFSNLTVMVYDAEAVKAAGLPTPDSFFDLWAPGYKNRVSIPQFTNTYAFATLARTTSLLGGDPAVTMDPGFAKIREMKPNIRTFMGPLGQVIQLFQQKEIWLCFVPQFSAVQAAAAGLPIRWALPKEGAVATAHYIAIPKGAPNPEEAQKLANFMLSPESQAFLAEDASMGAVNTKTRLSPAVATNFPPTEAVVNAAHVPWAIYNRDRVTLSERWQREIQQ
ncbi:extracellular solute-binding protein [Bradyrhizobium sp. LHD-71]|uniref:extracellular solute-binding protein n=1 Tax=Bradyrhizobium sp. LHD-71 TaxID=3072141 RepID=UPI00280DC36E|nr:extracellular solute-binding protein [Bradyrhizobium sp. LHD-71]MDQ8729050.1 extracellular solute-binding protein [Bradyrhizobium sp. LHD-71]